MFTKIEIYEPAVLVVGTRGRNLVGGMQALMPGSVSKYCLQQSPIPVVVVRPSTKRMKKKKKRQEDPTRRNYDHILELSGAKSGLVLDKSSKHSPIGPLPGATEQEAEAVAQAVGVQQGPSSADEGAPLSRVVSGRSDVSSGPESPSPTGPLSPDPRSVVLKSPTLDNIDSPSASEDSEQEDEESSAKSKIEERAGNATEAVVEEVLPSLKASEGVDKG